MSYISVDLLDLDSQNDVQFVHELSFPKDVNYLTETYVKVTSSVNGKYTKIGGNSDCIDVHDGVTCDVTCSEEDMCSTCDCHRYEFRHFVDDRKSNHFCTVAEREICLKKNPKFNRTQN